MGTAKRERQKANRQLKKVQDAKQARRKMSKKWLVRVLIGVPLAVLFVVLIAQPWNDDDTPTTPTTPTLLDTTTLPLLDTTTVATTVAATG